MALKLILLPILLVVNAQIISGSAPLLHAPIAAPLAVSAEPYDPNPEYSYGYDVQDPLTGDSHGQFEIRSGDVVRGRYFLVDPDGTRRVVDYTADSIHGFNAVVSKEPLLVKTAVVAPVARVVAPQPVAVRAVAPVPVAPVPVAPVVRATPVIPSGPWAAPALRGAPWAGPIGRVVW